MSPSSSRVRRLAWFALLWLAGVAAVGALAYLLRAVIFGIAGPSS